MFDDFIRELRRLEGGVRVSVPLQADENGYLDRQCPASTWRAEFKIHESDSGDKVSGDHFFCPLCRHEDSPDEWATGAQVAYAKKVAFSQFSRSVHRALTTGAARFNQRQRSSFIPVSLSVKPGSTRVLLPRSVGEAMQQRFCSDSCGCRYASIGAAYFCPACGHNSVLSTFEQTLNHVRDAVKLLPTLRQALGSDRDAAENAARLVLEQSLTKVVGGFEYFTEALFTTLPNSSSISLKRGCFQRLGDASELWRRQTGAGYDTILGVSGFADLRRIFQRRHLIAHREGIVDADYIRKSGDQDLSVGQRISVKEAEVLMLISLVRRVFEALKSAASIPKT